MKLYKSIGCLVLLSALNTVGQPLRQRVDEDALGYVLGPDDQIVIRVFEGLDLSEKPILIGTNGDITVPLIGRVKAGGLTVEQLETELTNRLKKYIWDPQVFVTVGEFRSHPVSVLGAVNSPGVIQLRGEKTLYEVLAMAGGPRDTAGSTITVTRLLSNGEIPLAGATTDLARKFSSAELSVREILDGKNPAANITIKPNDVITVSQANASMIYVVGDVQRSGAFTLGAQKTISVLSAVSLAGGLGRTAKPEQAKIFRHIPGQVKSQEIPVNIKEIFAGKNEDLGLHPEDVLVVPTSTRKAFATYIVPAAVAAAVSAAIYAGVTH